MSWLTRSIGRLIRSTLKESAANDLFGKPDLSSDLDRRASRNTTALYSPQIYKERLQTIKTVQELNRVRNLSRIMYEVNPNAQGGVDGLCDYLIGKGATTTFQATDDKHEPPIRLTKQATELLDEFKKLNQWKRAEREIYRRFLIDGEVFIQLTPDEDGITRLQFIEPDAIVPPEGENNEGPWSWGIKKEKGKPVAYNVRDHVNSTEAQIPAQFIHHLKGKSNLNQKRGLPALTSCIDVLQGSQKLRRATREGEAVRASIAYVRQHATAPQSAVQALQDANSDGTYQRTTPNGSQDLAFQMIDGVVVQDIPDGLEYKPPPQSPNSAAVEYSIRGDLESVAAALRAPFWLISGDSSASSYASSLTAESPFIRMIEAEQEVVSDYMDDVQTSVLEIAAEQGALPDDVMEQLDLHVTLNSPVTRNRLEEAQRHVILVQQGWESPQTAASDQGLDYEKEQANIAAIPPTPLPQQPSVTPQKQPETASGQMGRDQGSVA